MDKILFDKLLLQTAFCCMASDGNIDPREINLIKSLCKDLVLYANTKIEELLNALVDELNLKGKEFISTYFKSLKSSELSEQEELELINVAIKTIHSDNIVEYSEIKFFKVIRRYLKISNVKILAVYPDIEQFLAEDINAEYIVEKITKQYFDIANLPKFEHISLGEISGQDLKKND